MNFASKSVIQENPLGFFTCRKAGTWDILFYFPSEGRHTEDFPDARKIQWLRPGLNPRTRVPVASMLTTRPPKPSEMHTNSTSIILALWYANLRPCINGSRWFEKTFRSHLQAYSGLCFMNHEPFTTSATSHTGKKGNPQTHRCTNFKTCLEFERKLEQKRGRP